MKVIMLSGPVSSGKTTTINMVYDELIKTAKPIIQRPVSEKIKDFEAVVDYKNARGVRQKVALASMGDYSIEVIHYMSFYEGMGCEVLICACRDYFSNPFRRLNKRYKETHKIIKKNAPTDDDNKKAMCKIIAHI